MARYVNVEEHCEKLMKRIEELKVRADAAESQRNHPLAEELHDEADNLLTAVILLRQIPEADVSEVKHGKWVKDGDFLICLNCDNEINIKNSLGVENSNNYCPECGAKMVERENTGVEDSDKPLVCFQDRCLSIKQEKNANAVEVKYFPHGKRVMIINKSDESLQLSENEVLELYGLLKSVVDVYEAQNEFCNDTQKRNCDKLKKEK